MNPIKAVDERIEELQAMRALMEQAQKIDPVLFGDIYSNGNGPGPVKKPPVKKRSRVQDRTSPDKIAQLIDRTIADCVLHEKLKKGEPLRMTHQRVGKKCGAGRATGSVVLRRMVRQGLAKFTQTNSSNARKYGYYTLTQKGRKWLK